MKNFITLFITTLIFVLVFSPISYARDKEYKIKFSGYYSEKITNPNEYALSKAAEFSKKKGYEFFVIKFVRRYERASKSMERIGARTSGKKRPTTELIMHCYDEYPDAELIYNTASIIEEMSNKYDY